MIARKFIGDLKHNHIMNTENQPIDLVSAALVECQGELKAAEFDATNPFFKSKYATLGSVIAASRQALSKAGLAILQIPTINEHLVSVHTKIIHKSGQMLDCGAMTLSLGESDRNSDAQLAGSITTYLRRYAWSTVLGIYADSDDDGNSAPQRPPGAIPRRQTTPTTPQPQPSLPEPRPATDKHRLKALNNLNAAPGQANARLVENYLRSKLWIAINQGVLDWPLEHVPATPEQMSRLSEDVIKFEIQQREGAQP